MFQRDISQEIPGNNFLRKHSSCEIQILYFSNTAICRQTELKSSKIKTKEFSLHMVHISKFGNWTILSNQIAIFQDYSQNIQNNP